MRFIYLLLIISLLFIGAGHAEGSSVHLRQKIVDPSTITLTAVLDPTEPIRGWEFKIRYHTSSLLLSRVFCGDFYYNRTFSNPGAFDNANGTLIDVYGLILGWGNITNSTDLCEMTFTVVNETDSDVDFYEGGICNSTSYVQCSFINLTVHFPSFSFLTGGWGSFSNAVSWTTVSRDWASFGNAPLSPDGHVADRFTSPQTRAPDHDAFSAFVGTMFAAILVMGLLLSLAYSFRRK